jgi:hypothetical protein
MQGDNYRLEKIHTKVEKLLQLWRSNSNMYTNIHSHAHMQDCCEEGNSRLEKIHLKVEKLVEGYNSAGIIRRVRTVMKKKRAASLQPKAFRAISL